MSATSLFNYLKQHNSFSIDRREVSFYYFSMLRHSLLSIIRDLHEGDVFSRDISNTLRTRLSEWLTVPIPFDERIENGISILGDPDSITCRWGLDIMTAYKKSLCAATKLNQIENPIRSEIRGVVDNLRNLGSNFKIICHKLARPHFASIIYAPHESVDEDLFIHTPKDYRSAKPFDVLIKIGPLRSRGWGAAPDALLTAPRFETLVHIVWSGCRDEQGFGLDPASDSVIIGAPSKNGILWALRTRDVGDNNNESGLAFINEDEFQVFATIDKTPDKRSAVLALIDETHGVLFPEGMSVLSFNPSAKRTARVDRRLPRQTLTENMFLILPQLNDIDLGGLQAKDGKLSPVWKARLISEIKKDQDGLCKKLFDRGIKLVCLSLRVKDWCKAPTTVIPAPQKADHFKILINVLGIDFETDMPHGQRMDWWRYAWWEIQRSRGEAISEGLLEQEIKEEKIEKILNDLLDKISEQCENADDFSLEMSPGNELRGSFRFSKVIALEDGFRAPDTEFKKIIDIREFEQWRV